jgi:hypothetical protein
MVVNAHLDQYDGLRVVNFGSGDAPEPGERVAWAVRLGMDRDPREDLFDQAFGRFLDSVDTASVTHLVIGFWDTDCMADSSDVQQLLADAAPRLPNLKALFFGDATFEESEISWMEQSDLSALLAAYPDLERLDVRGGTGLRLPSLSGSSLRVLRLETGGLPADVVRTIGASDLPHLQTLELWLGAEDYGGDTTVADLAPILSGERLPALTRLGLMDSEIQDEICAAVATAPIVARLSELVLSKGVLTDEGAEALLSGQSLTHLTELDLRYHFMTEPMIARLREALAPVNALLIDEPRKREAWDDEDWRFVEVAE